MLETPEFSRTQRTLVLDTTVLSNFAAVGQMPFLELLYRGQSCTTFMVVEEIRRGLEAGYTQLQAVQDSLIPLRPTGWLPLVTLESAEEQALYIHLSSSLGPGEASCLVVAHTHRLTLATDDLAARRKAGEYEIRLTGTIGILIRLVREGHLSLIEGNSFLAQMIALRYRAPIENLNEII